MDLSFTVYGHPQPQGSAKAFIPKNWKSAVITTDNKALKPWRQDVAGTAFNLLGSATPTKDAVEIQMVFYFERPKSTSKKILHKTTKPDVDKLCRAVADALTGIAFQDDSQVVLCVGAKRFGTPERAEIHVRSIPTNVTVATQVTTTLDLFSFPAN